MVGGYGRVSRLMHWVAAALLIWQFAVIAVYGLTGGGPRIDRIAAHGPSHGSVGLMILGLTVLRGAWAFANRARRPRHPGLLGRVARAVHAFFYAAMLAIPLLGMLRAYGSGEGWVHWGAQIVPATGRQTPWMTATADLLHGELAWVMSALIVGHVGMALMHRLQPR